MGHYECSICGNYLCSNAKCASEIEKRYSNAAPKQDEMTNPVDELDMFIAIRRELYGKNEIIEFRTHEQIQNFLTNKTSKELNSISVYKARKVNFELKLIID